MIKTKKVDYFNQDELLEIYKKAGSADIKKLKDAAAELYPDRMAAEEPPMLRSETGIHGRWFYLDEKREGPPQAPKYTVKSGRCSWIGIMEDGTAVKY